MKLNIDTSKFYNTMMDRYGHILSKYTIIEHIQNSINQNQCEIAIAKDYITELQSSWN